MLCKILIIACSLVFQSIDCAEMMEELPMMHDDSAINRGVQKSQTVFDLWVQDALRARLLAIDNYWDINGNLFVGGNTLINQNLAVGDNTVIGGSLLVDGPAYFNEIYILGPSGCSGVLEICGTFYLNGTGITGPTHVTGPTGAVGPPGPQGPTGPTGPAGALSTTGASLTLVDNIPSTNCTNGTLVVAGGAGIGGNLNVCGYINTDTDYRIGTFIVLDATGSNLSVGTNAGTVAAGSDNVFVGDNAAQSNAGAVASAIVGYAAAQSLTSGTNNTAMGTTAAMNLTTGTDNTIIGFEAGESMGAADARNTYVGSQAGLNNAGGSDNVIIGALAANSVTSAISTTVAIGGAAGEFASASSNVFLGYLSGQALGPTLDVLVGSQTKNPGAGNSNNTALGSSASVNTPGGTSGNTAIGAGVTITSGNNQMQLGTSTTSVYVSTAGGAGSLFLPTVGGTPTGLNYYEVYNQTETIGYGGTDAMVNLNITRIGNMVTLVLDQFPTLGIVGGGPNVFLMLPVIPARFAPPIAAGARLSTVCAPVIEDSPSAGVRAAGEWQVYGNGVMQIWYFDQVDADAAFPGDQYHSGGQLTISYSLAS